MRRLPGHQTALNRAAAVSGKKRCKAGRRGSPSNKVLDGRSTSSQKDGEIVDRYSCRIACHNSGEDCGHVSDLAISFGHPKPHSYRT